MANFSLSLKLQNSLIPLTIFKTNTSDTLSNSTFEEEFSIESNTYCTLNFSMMKYYIKDGVKTFNYPTNLMYSGAELRYIDKYNDVYDFIIKNISYTIMAENVQIKYECQDKFSYLMTKRNNGYEITDNIEDGNYVGALTLDKWAWKIQRECAIDWGYQPVDSFNPINDIKQNILRIKKNYVDDTNEEFTLNERRSFSIKNSNAYNALVSLAQAYDMNLYINFNEKYFAFQPNKSYHFSGLTFSPKVDLQSLGLTVDTSNLTTILSVQGGTDKDGNEISLLPDIPSEWLEYFGTDAWLSSTYSSSLYNIINANFKNQDSNFLKQLNRVPYLDNKIINFEYFKNKLPLLSAADLNDLNNLIYNKLRIMRGRLMYYTNLYVSNYTTTREQIRIWEQDYSSAAMNFEALCEMWYDTTYNSKTWDKNLATTYISNYNTQIVKTNSSNTFTLVNKDSFVTTYLQDYEQNLYNLFDNTYNFLLLYKKYKNNVSSMSDLAKACLESNLSKYWDNMITCGKFCGYYFPDNWSFLENYNNIVDVSKVNMETCDKILLSYNPTSEDGYYKTNDTLQNNILCLDTYSPIRGFNIDKNNLYYVSYGMTQNNYRAIRQLWSFLEYFKYSKLISFINTEMGDNGSLLTSDSHIMYGTYGFMLQQILKSTERTCGGHKINIDLNWIGSLSNDMWYEKGLSISIEPEEVVDISQYEKMSTDLTPLYRYELFYHNNKIIEGATLVFNNKNRRLKASYYDGPKDCSIYTVLDGMTEEITLTNNIASSMSIAKAYKSLQDEYTIFWTNLYQKYSNVCYTNTYTDKDATNADLLYLAAYNQFLDWSEPEPKFDLSIIDINALKGDISKRIQITDYILLNDNDMELQYDNLKAWLQTQLYITKMSYRCRNDNDVKLEVDKFKYSNKMIGGILKLLQR